jgi:hypothetical protein
MLAPVVAMMLMNPNEGDSDDCSSYGDDVNVVFSFHT